MQSQSNPARSLLSRTSRGAVPTPPITPTIILYGVSPDIAAECERVARELHVGRTEVRHLQAACGALKAHPKSMLVVSSSLRSWDRLVVEEHAARAAVPIRWVVGDQQADEVANDVRSWVSDTLRRARTSASR